MAQLENSYGWMKNPYGRMKMDFPMAQPPYGRTDAYGRTDDPSLYLGNCWSDLAEILTIKVIFGLQGYLKGNIKALKPTVFDLEVAQKT